jgi:hypothetical protein
MAAYTILYSCLILVESYEPTCGPSHEGQMQQILVGCEKLGTLK